MRQPSDRRQRTRRLEALCLAALVLWTVSVTAGSPTAAAAGQALANAIPGQMLRWTIGDFQIGENLSPAAAMTLSQSALLLSAREQLRRTHEAENPLPEVPEPPEPVPNPAPSPEVSPDNGIPARTLVPKDPKGYSVFGSAYISSTRETPLDLAALETPPKAQLGEEGPQILILHSHGSEAYTPAGNPDIVWSGNHRSTDMRYGVVRVGDAMADVFSEAGISVLHDRTLYDYPSYPGSYDRSLEAAQRHLEAHPSIRFILDIHRDAIEDQEGNQYKVISQTPQGTASQMTLVVGSNGSGAPHPDWMENLRLAVALQQRLLEDHPTLMRPILLRKSRYNQHLTPGCLLVEVGAAGNSPEEAELAGRIFAEEMAAYLLEALQSDKASS